MMNKYKIIVKIGMAFLFLSNLIFWRSYPLKYISKPWCKFENRNNLSSDCKMLLPKIYNANYKKYKDNIKYRLIYSVLWLSTYKNWWDIWYWSHEGIDIASSLGTPVYSIWNWTVTTAWYLKWRWNTVVIKHYIWNGKYIRSIYAHLNKIFVKKWQKVKEGQKIWEIGHSWLAWWNHLHFQIDINQYWTHPYYPIGCGNPIKMVNYWLCKNKIIKNTIDPIYFLEKNWANFIKNSPSSQISQIPEKIVKKEKISPKTIIPREKLKLTELELFLSRYKIKIESFIPANVLYISKKWLIKIKIFKKNWKLFSWLLPETIKIESQKKIVNILPSGIKYIPNGTRNITIYPKKLWTDIITIKFWKKILKQIPIRIISKNTKIKPYHSLFRIQTNFPHIWDEIRTLTILQDKNYSNIIKVPFIWKYTIKIKNWLICPIKITLKNIKKLSSIKCSTSILKNSYSFSYQDTLLWILLYKIIPTTLNKNIQIIIYDQKWKIIWSKKIYNKTKLPIDFVNPNLWKSLYYKKYVKKSLLNLITRNYKIWKFVPDFNLKTSTAINWVKNLKHLIYKNSDITYQPLNKYYISRLEFVKLIAENLHIYSNINKKIFWDTNPKIYKYTNLLVQINWKFLDSFWKNFFQPNKTITRDEAAYILEKFYEYFIYKNRHSY